MKTTTLGRQKQKVFTTFIQFVALSARTENCKLAAECIMNALFFCAKVHHHRGFFALVTAHDEQLRSLLVL
jgi:hypothetical protein